MGKEQTHPPLVPPPGVGETSKPILPTGHVKASWCLLVYERDQSLIIRRTPIKSQGLVKLNSMSHKAVFPLLPAEIRESLWTSESSQM